MRTLFVISRTSPASLAIAATRRFRMTGIGYCWGEGCNVYNHPEELLSPQMAVPSLSHSHQLVVNR